MKTIEREYKLNFAKDTALDLVYIDAESLIEDMFRWYEPKNARESEIKELILEAIQKGVKNFWITKGDVSFTDEERGICYAPGKMPAVGKSYDWHEKAALELCPELISRLGSRLEYGAFLGVLIMMLIEEGNTPEWAWNAVCYDSRELGHYWNSENSKPYFEPTGSREICGICDFANTFKILAWDDEAGGFWLAGGSCNTFSDNYPIAGLYLNHCTTYERYDSVGWVVLS